MAIFAKIETVGDTAMPMLAIINDVSPIRHSYTRHGTITTSRFPELLFGGDELLLDELIAPGTDAPDNFSGAMSRFSGNNEQPISLMAFDVLSYHNEKVNHWPIEERKELLTVVISVIDSQYINLSLMC